MDLDFVQYGCCADAQHNTRVMRGKIAAATGLKHVANLATCFPDDPGTDRIAITAHSLELNSQPVVSLRSIVLQKDRGASIIHNDNIDCPIIVSCCWNTTVRHWLYAMILRASPSGSSTMRHSLSQIIVLLVSGSVGCHFKPGRLGFPVAANAAQDEAIFFANACASGVLPVPCSQRFVLSKQN